MSTDFHRIRRLPPYVFEEVNKIKARLRAEGTDIIDFGMGNPDSPTPPHIVAKMIEDVFTRYAAGRDPHDIENLWRRVYSSGFTQHSDLSVMGVLSALEMACWDIAGKAAGKPIYELLGGAARPLAVGDAVPVGSVVKTGAASRAVVVLDRKSVV